MNNLHLELLVIAEKIHDALLDFVEKCDYESEIHSDLSGACAVASQFIVIVAKKDLGIDCQFQHNAGHCWIVFDGMVYDATAIQFASSIGISEEEKVHSFPVPNKHKYPYHQSFVNNQPVPYLSYDDGHIEEYWPPGQRPSDYSLEKRENGSFVIKETKEYLVLMELEECYDASC